MSDELRMADLGPLHDLLLRASPVNKENGLRSIPTLAAAINYTPQGLYKMIRLGKVSSDAAVKIVAVSDGRVSLEEFHPYVYA